MYFFTACQNRENRARPVYQRFKEYYGRSMPKVNPGIFMYPKGGDNVRYLSQRAGRMPEGGVQNSPLHG